MLVNHYPQMKSNVIVFLETENINLTFIIESKEQDILKYNF